MHVAEAGVVNKGVGVTVKKAGRNKFIPNTDALGSHSVYRKDSITGKILKYETYRPQSNPLNPNLWESVKRFDGYPINETHYNKILQKPIRTPHVHDPLTPGGVRVADIWEIPK